MYFDRRCSVSCFRVDTCSTIALRFCTSYISNTAHFNIFVVSSPLFLRQIHYLIGRHSVTHLSVTSGGKNSRCIPQVRLDLVNPSLTQLTRLNRLNRLTRLGQSTTHHNSPDSPDSPGAAQVGQWATHQVWTVSHSSLNYSPNSPDCILYCVNVTNQKKC